MARTKFTAKKAEHKQRVDELVATAKQNDPDGDWSSARLLALVNGEDG